MFNTPFNSGNWNWNNGNNWGFNGFGGGFPSFNGFTPWNWNNSFNGFNNSFNGSWNNPFVGSWNNGFGFNGFGGNPFFAFTPWNWNTPFNAWNGFNTPWGYNNDDWSEPSEFTGESFNGSFRDELLNETLFSSLTEAREKITAWKDDYNQHRPHSSLGNLTPQEFALKSKLETKAA